MYPWQEPAHKGPPRYLRQSQDPNWPYKAVRVERIDGGLRTITGKPISRTIGTRSRGYQNAGIDTRVVGRRIGTPAPGWMNQGIDERPVPRRSAPGRGVIMNRRSGLFDNRPVGEPWQQPAWGPTTTAYTRGMHASALPGLSGLGAIVTNNISGWTCTPHTGEISVRYTSGGSARFFSLPLADQTAILSVPELAAGFREVLARCGNPENIRQAQEHWNRQKQITAQDHARADADAARVQKSFFDTLTDELPGGGGGGPSLLWWIPATLVALVGAAALLRR